MTNDLATVSKALLAEVLNTAMSDNYSTESEFAVYDNEHNEHELQRKKIRELMILAGIEDEEEVGQGFFGLALALKEQEKP
jgi:hypothetical protein